MSRILAYGVATWGAAGAAFWYLSGRKSGLAIEAKQKILEGDQSHIDLNGVTC